jgi:endonuclease/exonuclease/phosphatase family metal-dependent hydrolase
MKIISWNVNGRTEDAARRQLKAILRRKPDVLALQEVTFRPSQRSPGSYAIWSDGLLRRGYSVVSTVDLVGLPYPEPDYPTPPLPLSWQGRKHDHIQRKYFNLIASLHPMIALGGLAYGSDEEALLGFPEKHIAARIQLNRGEVDVHNTHLPPGVSRGLLKVHHFEAVRRRLDRDSGRRRILCGDFNAPESENLEGPSFDVEGPWSERWSAEEKKRWALAEKRVLANEALPDLYDAHSGARPPASHYTGRNKTPRRYDHIFASSEIKRGRCVYLTRWIASGLSDHAPVEAELFPRSGR